MTLDASNAALVDELCARLDGIPLAIELAAARTATLPLDEIVRRLDDRFELLRSRSPSLPERHRSLEAAVTWSYDLLADDERRVLQRLCVFRGGFTLEAAEAVCVVPGTVDALATLVQRSLLEFDGARYRLLETIREFAAERMPGDERRALDRRQAQHFLAVARRSEFDLLGGDRTAVLAMLADVENLRAALIWTQANAHDLHVELAAWLGEFWYAARLPVDGDRWIESSLSLSPKGLARARILLSRHRLAQMRWTPDARDVLEAAALFEDAGDRGGAIRALFLAGWTVATFGEADTERGVALVDRAIELARADEHEIYLGMALATKSLCGSTLRASVPLVRAGAEILMRTRGSRFAAMCLGSTAYRAIVEGSYRVADELTTEARHAAELSEDNLAVVMTKGNQGRVSLLCSRKTSAARRHSSRNNSRTPLPARAGCATPSNMRRGSGSRRRQRDSGTPRSAPTGWLQPMRWARPGCLQIATDSRPRSSGVSSDCFSGSCAPRRQVASDSP